MITIHVITKVTKALLAFEGVLKRGVRLVEKSEIDGGPAGDRCASLYSRVSTCIARLRSNAYASCQMSRSPWVFEFSSIVVNLTPVMLVTCHINISSTPKQHVFFSRNGVSPLSSRDSLLLRLPFLPRPPLLPQSHLTQIRAGLIGIIAHSLLPIEPYQARIVIDEFLLVCPFVQRGEVMCFGWEAAIWLWSR